MSDTKEIVLVTGASRGLGFAVAGLLAGPHRHIIAIARTIGGLEELDDVIQARSGSATLVPMDITDEQALQSMGKSIFDRFGRIDLFIHAAAHAVPRAPVGHVADKDLDRAWAVNARATQRLITMIDPLLKAAPAGRAIHVDDRVNSDGFLSAYAASKDAARRFVREWAEESRRTGPKVSLFEPGPMPTALRARFSPGEDRGTLSDCQTEASRLIDSLRP